MPKLQAYWGEITTNEESALIRMYLDFIRVAIAQSRDCDKRELLLDFDRAGFTRKVSVELEPVLGRVVESGGKLYREVTRGS